MVIVPEDVFGTVRPLPNMAKIHGRIYGADPQSFTARPKEIKPLQKGNWAKQTLPQKSWISNEIRLSEFSTEIVI